MLYRQHRQIHIIAFNHDVVYRRFFHHIGRHRPNVFEQRQFGKRVFDAFGWLRFFQISQGLAYLTQLAQVFGPHAHGHAFGGAKQVRQYGKVVAFAIGGGVFKQQGRAFGTQHAVGDVGHLQMR